MKSVLIITLITSFLSTIVLADVTPKFGFTSIKKNSVIVNGEEMVGYEYCKNFESSQCEQIGESKYYPLAVLEERAKKESTQVGLIYASIPLAAAAGLFGGMYIEAALYYAIIGTGGGAVIPLLGGVVGLAGAGASPVAFTKNQRIQVKVLMLKRKKSEIVVKDDKVVLRYKEQLEKVLAKIDNQ